MASYEWFLIMALTFLITVYSLRCAAYRAEEADFDHVRAESEAWEEAELSEAEWYAEQDAAQIDVCVRFSRCEDCPIGSECFIG